MSDLLTNVQGYVAKLLSSAAIVSDSAQTKQVRQAARGELITMGLLTPQQAAAVEGSYFTWANQGTRNTGVTLTATTGTSYSSTVAICVVANTNVAGGPDVILDELEIKYDAVNTAGVGGFLYHTIDDGNRWSSGGTAMTGFNADGNQPSGVLAYTGAITATAASTAAARDLGQTVYLNGVGPATPIMTLKIKFGGQLTASNSFATPATAGVEATFFGPAVVIRPGKSYVCHEFQTSRTAAGTGEFFLRAIVR